jgi:hypothetical protein
VRRVGARAAALALALAPLACGCGGDDPAPEPTPPPPPLSWSAAQVDGLPSPSAVCRLPRFLLFLSSETSRLYVVAREDLQEGAALRAREIALEVEGQREGHLRGDRGVRSFRLAHLWEGPQRLSGIAVSPDGVLYAASEAYRVVWFGPLEVGGDGAPTRCRFQRMFEVEGARRTRVGESDWQDYGDATATNGIAGVAVEGDDLLVVERGRGDAEPRMWRLDRLSGGTLEPIPIRFGERDPGSERWWSDVAATRGGFLACLVRRREESSAARLLFVPVDRQTPRGTRTVARVWLDLPESPKGEPYEGFATGGGEIFAVRAAGKDAAVVLWRKSPD